MHNHAGHSILIRKAQVEDALGIASVRVVSWRSAYQGIVASDVLKGLSIEKTAKLIEVTIRSDAPGRCNLVAQDTTGQIVGFALGGPERTNDPEYDGELYAIYLLPEFFRVGIGRQLLLQMAECLVQQGMHSMLIWVLSRNPARGFYEAMGGVLLREQLITIGQDALPEVAYGWQDLESLLHTST